MKKLEVGTLGKKMAAKFVIPQPEVCARALYRSVPIAKNTQFFHRTGKIENITNKQFVIRKNVNIFIDIIRRIYVNDHSKPIV